ncbi:MAG: hypothetical protein O3B03_07505 [Proteobacteria bacterium]|nr:hypothetical protein [Pseudomonadota bacterium]MDA1331087.1 hypothetical protein [Pseudomonadota bacterium]
MPKNTNIANIIKNHSDLTRLQRQIDTMEIVRAEIGVILPKNIQNKVEIVLATPKTLTIFTGTQIIGAKIRQMSPTVLHHIQNKKGCEMVETIEIKVTPNASSMPKGKRKTLNHTQSTLGFIDEMRKKLLKL